MGNTKKYPEESRWHQLVIAVPVNEPQLKGALKSLAEGNGMSLSKQCVKILKDHLVRRDLL